MKNTLKDQIKNGERVLGGFVGMYSPNLVEMIGYAGFNFIVIDDEHAAFSYTELENLIRTAENVGLVPLVRVSYDPSSIQKALDRGAKGIQVPMVNTKEDAENVIAQAKFPPFGNRGVAFSHRAARYGMDNGEAFIDSSNEEILVIPHIETVEATENFEEIMSVAGIDIAFIGSTDLSVNMGFKKEGAKHPDVQKRIARLYETAQKNNYTIGTVAGDLTSVNDAFDKGAKYVGVVTNTVIFEGLKNLVGQSES
ncbi:aldolase/citrate lyase family protein [uncultured Planococcus sp.]|uniref:HpcH/HpaI aldolase family protein n=1 Tax=uncultured Planococcus sp. TaxID=337815 RepID=UPI0026300D5D|nr:aldolase/citrate lyase family protein [uncultured Planococcus sp.]